MISYEEIRQKTIDGIERLKQDAEPFLFSSNKGTFEQSDSTEAIKPEIVKRYALLPYIKYLLDVREDLKQLIDQTVQYIPNVCQMLTRYYFSEDFFKENTPKRLTADFINAHINAPEGADQPLEPSEIKAFNSYVVNVVKPTLTAFCQGTNAYARTYSEISEQMAAILNTWAQTLNAQTHEYPDELLESLQDELYTPRNDLVQLLNEYNRKQYPYAHIKKANTHIDNTTAAFHQFYKMENGEEKKLLVSPKNKAKPRYTALKVSSDYEINPKLCTYLHLSIISAVESLAASGNEFVTVEMLYRHLNGNADVKLTPKAKENIENTIEYLKNLNIEIDPTDHYLLNKLKDNEFVGLEGKALCMIKGKRRVANKIISGYIYEKKSPLYDYACNVKQISNIPIVLLDTTAVLIATERTLSLKPYLLHRIHTMKGQGNVIRLDAICEAIGETSPTKRELDGIRRSTEQLLHYWSYGRGKDSKSPPQKEVTAVSPICGYEVIHEGNRPTGKVTGYKLIPRKTQKEPLKS